MVLPGFFRGQVNYPFESDYTVSRHVHKAPYYQKVLLEILAVDPSEFSLMQKIVGKK
jgi:hypothetical protein